MEKERDEMFRLTAIKMSSWSMAAKYGSQNAKQAALALSNSGGAAQMGSKNKKEKKDKPNPNQPAKIKEPKPQKPSTYVADTTPLGEKKNCLTPMNPEYHPKAVEAAWYAWWEK